MKRKWLVGLLTLAVAAALLFLFAPDSATNGGEPQQGDMVDLTPNQAPDQSNSAGVQSETEFQNDQNTPDIQPSTPDNTDTPTSPDEPELLPEDGSYTSKEDVALYIVQYGTLPKNFITKSEAEELGWSGGSLEPYAPGKCIGGDSFGNREGLLPSEQGRTYTECDIDTLGARSRGAKRIVFSNDGLVYYTEDHYESFELLYGEEQT